MQTYTLKRDGDRSLVFDGELLGSGSSKRDDHSRWFEVRIYRTVGGNYIVAGVGRSTVEGEIDRYWADTCTTGHEVVRALTRVDDDDVEYITRTARDALNEAAEADAGVRDAFLKRVA